MAESIFTKIVAGQIPSYKIYEDDVVYAFLDIGPLSRGHCLVVPKECYVRLEDVPPEVGAAIGRVLPMLARAVVKATGAPAYNVLQNNGRLAHQVVEHVHFHIIPKYAPAPGSGSPGSGSPGSGSPGSEHGSGLGIDWPAGELKDGQKLRDAIVAALGEGRV